MSTEENISLLRRWYREVWREGKNDTIRELIAPDARLRGQIGPEAEIRGPEGFIAFAENIRKAMPDTEVEVEDIFAVGDRVAARWVATGTHTGEGLGIAPSGNRARVCGMTIVKIVNGKVVEGWDNWDRLGLLEQIGAYQVPEEAILAKSVA